MAENNNWDRPEAFLLNELEAGKKQTSLDTRIWGLRVFFSFCAEREYMQPVNLSAFGRIPIED